MPDRNRKINREVSSTYFTSSTFSAPSRAIGLDRRTRIYNPHAHPHFHYSGAAKVCDHNYSPLFYATILPNQKGQDRDCRASILAQYTQLPGRKMEVASHQHPMIRQLGSGVRLLSRVRQPSMAIIPGLTRLPGHKMEVDSHQRPLVRQSGSGI